MKKYWGILLSGTVIVGVLFGLYAFAAYHGNDIYAGECSSLFHLPFLTLLPLLFAPEFGAAIGRNVQVPKNRNLFFTAFFLLSLFVLTVPIPFIAKAWSIYRILAATLLPAALSALTFRIGMLWGRKYAAFANADIVIALRQLHAVLIYAILLFSIAFQETLIPKFGMPIQLYDQSFLVGVCIWFPAYFVHPIVCAVLGWRIKSKYYVSNKRGLVLGLCVFVLFVGLSAFYYMQVSPLPLVLRLWWLIQDYWAFWLIPAAVNAMIFTAALLIRKNKIQESFASI